MSEIITINLLTLLVLELMVISSYFVLSVIVIPKLKIVHHELLLTSSLFFAACSLTHAFELFHFFEVVTKDVSNYVGLPEGLLFLPAMRLYDYMSLYMIINMAVQGLSTALSVRYIVKIQRGEGLTTPAHSKTVLTITAIYIATIIAIAYIEHEQLGGSILIGLIR